MEIDSSEDAKEFADYPPKYAPAAAAREAHQQKTTAESGDGDDSWLTSFLSTKGTLIVCI